MEDLLVQKHKKSPTELWLASRMPVFIKVKKKIGFWLLLTTSTTYLRSDKIRKVSWPPSVQPPPLMDYGSGKSAMDERVKILWIITCYSLLYIGKGDCNLWVLTRTGLAKSQPSLENEFSGTGPGTALGIRIWIRYTRTFYLNTRRVRCPSYSPSV